MSVFFLGSIVVRMYMTMHTATNITKVISYTFMCAVSTGE